MYINGKRVKGTHAASKHGEEPLTGEFVLKVPDTIAGEPISSKHMLVIQDRWLELPGVTDVELSSLPAGKYITVQCDDAPIFDELVNHIHLGSYYLTYVISYEPRRVDSRFFTNSYCAACKMAAPEQEAAWGTGYCYVRFKGEAVSTYTRGAHLLADVQQVFRTAAGFHITESDLQSVP